MQILGKRSKVLLTALCAVMLIAIGVSFAAWDSSAVKADSGNMSDYANAKVGQIIEFGNYYIDSTTTKKPMTWIVVDKNERTGQLTLMSQYIIACGSYFGNYYYNSANKWGAHYGNVAELSGNTYNQAYSDSTVRAYLNNLERLDMGGDQFVATNTGSGIVGGYVPSGKVSTPSTGLLSSVGFSNQRYYTGLTTATYADYKNTLGFATRATSQDLYYQRPLNDAAYTNRPIAKGFYDEAFTDDEKAKIIPKSIPGYMGYRWPDSVSDVSNISYIPGSVDKVWVASASELNVMRGIDWTNASGGFWDNSSDRSDSSVFEYFKNFSAYKNPYADRLNTSLGDALIAQRTALAQNSVQGNYSIPVYNKGDQTQAVTLNTNIGTGNTSNTYWTRSPLSYFYDSVYVVKSDTGGKFHAGIVRGADTGVRPCITLQY